MRDSARQAMRWIPATAYAALIFAVSALPGNTLPSRFPVSPHFVEYAAFGAIILWTVKGRLGWVDAILLSTVAASAYGVTDELHQAFVPARTPDAADWLMDTGGAFAGALTAALLLSRLRRRQ